MVLTRRARPILLSTTPSLRNFGRRRSDITLVANDFALQRLEPLVGRDKLNIVAAAGGRFVATNLPLPNTTLPPAEEQRSRDQNTHRCRLG